ncbi:ATP-binding cassette domain-containing protein [Pararhizobium antarcticum]|uniref:ABC transporter ATP-binding protein n=1 Tax=Pararhizobium antarcticum TaxID=1798805 RepID=A0A657LSQ3_9HYPH|nr:ATP-binding cassette domain-containing protein [Pararhizobium antarcticum]OJF97429.1 ABC transporter ATP-binding protein [Pararhizobium antarcticum]OJF99688.1 ABC transporter ATP-binding protein [Rhizobium sp. 58]
MTNDIIVAGLVLAGIEIWLGDHRLIALSAEVQPSRVLTVMGPSGSGKSTLLAFIGGFLDPVFKARGDVTIEGVNLTDLAPESRRAGILFQDPLLFPHMSVGANVAFAVPATISRRSERVRIAAHALAEVELDDFAARDPATLSGGQKARVALARVLVSQPRLLLLDEPFSKLDMALRQQMRSLVFTKAQDAGLPVILVTHDEADAQSAGGEIYRMDAVSGQEP